MALTVGQAQIEVLDEARAQTYWAENAAMQLKTIKQLLGWLLAVEAIGIGLFVLLIASASS